MGELTDGYREWKHGMAALRGRKTQQELDNANKILARAHDKMVKALLDDKLDPLDEKVYEYLRDMDHDEHGT